MKRRSSIAVVGGGVAGVTAAYLLQNDHDVTLFEKNTYVGGHTHTVNLPSGSDKGLAVDTGFIVMNDKTYPLLTRLLDRLHVARSETDMSFSYYSKQTGLQYGSSSLNSVFAQRENLIKPSYWTFLYEILKFFRIVRKRLNDQSLKGLSLIDFLDQEGFSSNFRDQYLLPMSAAIWSASYSDMGDFPMESFARFYENHGLLSVKNHPQWYFIKGGSQSYIRAFLNQFPGTVKTNSPIKSISRHDAGVRIHLSDGSHTDVDGVIIATHADEALTLLENPTDLEKDLLSPWRYSTNAVALHTDTRFLPPNIKARASWNAIREPGHTHDAPVSLTYDMTRLQHLDTSTTYCVTLNPAMPISKDHIIETMTNTHPIFDFAATETQSRLDRLNTQGKVWFCGSYFGYGFHEDAVRSAVNVGKQFGVSL